MHHCPLGSKMPFLAVKDYEGYDDDDCDDIHGAYHDGHYGQRELESG